jgi:thiol-disulfide isomerase/thioredoxin
MIKTIKLITLSLLLTTGFFAQDKAIEISGIIENGAGKTIILTEFVGNKQIVKDSVKINKKNKFKLNLTSSKPDFYAIKISQEEYALLTLDNTDKTNKNIEFNADANNFVKSYTVKGSNDCAEISNFTRSIYEFQETKNKLNGKVYAKDASLEQKNAAQISLDSLNNAFIKTRNDYINNNYKSICAIVAVGYLNPAEDLELLRKIEGGLAESVPESDYHLGVKTQLTQLETQIKLQEEQAAKQAAAEAKTAIGAIAPELNFKSPTGEVITLESLRGNYVLIDFWASWCRPCRMENPNVVNLYNKYAKDGFTVYSVSLDKNPASWQKAILDDGLIWPNHVSDLKQWQTEATKIYGFNGIPYTVLIDKEGKIIGKKLRGVALDEELKKIFGY